MNVILPRPFLISNLLALGFTLGISNAAFAQSTPTAAEIQASAERERSSEQLRSAIQRIARRPADPDALIDAGNASLALDDPNAALNFFTRANAARPNDGRIKLGLASANLRTENPFDALRLFDEAVKLGMAERAVAADRALAFDLLGNFARAQQDYALAGTIDSSDALRIKHAVSLSLSGRSGEADRLLVPLLQRNVGEAWRARAFMLAARGDLKESVKVTQGFMDARSASRFEPFLRRMPELTGAQQAAAIHFGHFPTRNLGRDSDAVRTVASAASGSSNSGGDGKLVPSGRPLGTQIAANQAATARPASPPVVRSTTPAASNGIRNVAVNLPTNSQAATARARILAAENAAGGLTLFKTSLPSPMPISPPPLPSQPLPTQSAVAAAPAGVSSPLLSTSQPIPPATSPQVAMPPPINIKLPNNPAPAPTIASAATISSENVPPAIPTTKEAAPTLPATNLLPPSTLGTDVVATSAIPAPIAPAISTPPNIPILRIAVPPSAGTTEDSVPAVDDFNPASAATVTEPVAPASTIVSSPPPAPTKTTGFDLEAIVSAIEVPESEQRQTVVPVDLNAIRRAEAKKAEAPVPAAKTDKKTAATDKKTTLTETNPPRIWVQISTGEVAAFRGDMRRYSAKNPDLFKGYQGWSSAWSKLNRLVVGPFGDVKAARKWEADFRKAGGNGFVWQSAGGTVVEKLK